MTEPYCAGCGRTVTPDGDHVEVDVVTDPREETCGMTYYWHKRCWFDACPTDDWSDPA
jgi:hypothetical protein